jgi:bifunctional pyridoxal-dependent enzyme with beta-cystathionase and maltose regulon repressor activities
MLFYIEMGLTITTIISSPHNPTGKVFNNQELSHIAALCRKYNILAITDEVKLMSMKKTKRC